MTPGNSRRSEKERPRGRSYAAAWVSGWTLSVAVSALLYLQIILASCDESEVTTTCSLTRGGPLALVLVAPVGAMALGGYESRRKKRALPILAATVFSLILYATVIAFYGSK